MRLWIPAGVLCFSLFGCGKGGPPVAPEPPAVAPVMVAEQPRILFMHYWGRGAAATLASSVKKALDLTKSGG
jgi:Domain of Unknown Function (DUF1259)